jgi:hypothetical protein
VLSNLAARFLSLETGHRVEFNNTCRLARTKGYMDRIIKEATEIKSHWTTSTGMAVTYSAEPGNPYYVG